VYACCGVGPTARFCLRAAEADDLRESLRYLRIDELLLMPWADATPTMPITSNQAK
jgi:hypothetical protein